MSKFLTTVVETYRVDSEAEVEVMLEKAKSDNCFTLVKYTSEKKSKKAQGEIIDEWYKLSLHKAFNDEKGDRDAMSEVQIVYEV